MAGRNRSEAAANFIRPVQQTLSCVTHDVLIRREANRANAEYEMTLARGVPTVLDGPIPLELTISQRFKILRTREPGKGPYKTSTLEYAYHLSDAEGQYVWFHWHPAGGEPIPHLHLGLLPRTEEDVEVHAILGGRIVHELHLPTGRITVENVIAFAIREFGVNRLRQDWQTILERNQAKHVKYRTWS